MDAGNRFTFTSAAPSLSIPTTLQASLLARLDRLAPTREVAQIGAIIGRSFSHEVISAVAEMPRQRLDDALEQLVHAELIFRRGSPPDAEYTFKHALVQDAAYSTLLRSRRQQLHGRVAATLENHFVEVVAAQPELIAHHYGEAGLNEKAVDYWLRAGQQAVARSAMAEAVAHLKKGLELAATMPSSRQHQVQELDLRLALSAALSATKGYSSPQVAETFSRISELADQVDEPTRLFPVLYGQWAYHLVRSEHRVALSFAERIEQHGELQNDVTLSLLGHFYHGISRYWLGEFAAAHALFEQSDNLRDPVVRNTISRMIPEDAYVAMLGYSSMVLAYLGYFDQAQSRADEGLLEARRLRHAHTLAYALSFKVTALRIVHMEHEIRTYADELFDLSNEHGFPIFAAIATQFRGIWSVAVGQARQGVTLITQAMDQMRATGAAISPPPSCRSCRAFARLGDPAEGLGKLREAAKSSKTDGHCDEGHVRCLQGDLLSASGDKAAAELNYREALAISGRHGWFTEGFDTLDLKEAKTLLKRTRAIDKTVSGRLTMKCTRQVFFLVVATALAITSASALEGTGRIPARPLPVPDTVSPAMQAAIGAPPLPFWNTHPKSADEWKAFVQQLADVTLKRLPILREQTGVKVEPTTLGGVKVFIITPREIAEGNRERVLVHVHGGGYVLAPGEAGTPEAILMAAFGRIKIISVDYRMPPDFPYPAAMDDAMAVYREVVKTTAPQKDRNIRHLDRWRHDLSHGTARQTGGLAFAWSYRSCNAMVRHDQNWRHLFCERDGGQYSRQQRRVACRCGEPLR